MTQWKRYLLWFAQDLVEFRYAVRNEENFEKCFNNQNRNKIIYLQEIQSLLKVSNIPHKLPTIKPGSVEVSFIC